MSSNPSVRRMCESSSFNPIKGLDTVKPVRKPKQAPKAQAPKQSVPKQGGIVPLKKSQYGRAWEVIPAQALPIPAQALPMWKAADKLRKGFKALAKPFLPQTTQTPVRKPRNGQERVQMAQGTARKQAQAPVQVVKADALQVAKACKVRSAFLQMQRARYGVGKTVSRIVGDTYETWGVFAGWLPPSNGQATHALIGGRIVSIKEASSALVQGLGEFKGYCRRLVSTAINA